MSPVNPTDWSFNPNYTPPPIYYDDARFTYDDTRITYDNIVLTPEYSTVNPTDWSQA